MLAKKFLIPRFERVEEAVDPSEVLNKQLQSRIRQEWHCGH